MGSFGYRVRIGVLVAAAAVSALAAAYLLVRFPDLRLPGKTGVAVLVLTAFSVAAWVAVAFLVLMHRSYEDRESLARALSESERSHRQLMERAVRDSEARTHAILDAAVEGIITIDERGIIRSANPSAGRIFGYQEGEMTGRNVSMLMPEPFRSEHDQYLASYRQSGEAKIIGIGREVVGRRKDGHTFPMDLSVSEVTGGGGRLFAGLVRDISERKRTQEEIARLNARLELQVEKLEASNRDLEAFAYSVSHDLRAPLRGIAGFTQALVEDCGDTLKEGGLHYVERVRANIDRMGQLIDDMLALSRISRAEINLVPVNVSDLAEDVLRGLRESDPGRSVSVKIAPEMTVRADKSLVRVLLENLIGNAWKYTAREAEVCIEVGQRREGERKIFYVSDNGVGFDMAYYDKLFQIFQRLHSPKDFEGTGVGLAIAERVIQRHGGEIRAESSPGEGARFEFTLN